MRRRPGDWLHRVLTRYVDPQTFADVIEPTIADLQHEVQRADQDAWRRGLALVRGYAALVRVLLRGGLQSTPAINRVLVLVGLSVGGAALMTCARLASGSDSRPFVSAYLLPMFITPVVLSRAGLGVSYRRLFAGCAAVALMTQGLDIGSNGIRAYLVYHVRLGFRLGDLIDFVAALVAFSAVVAVAAWQPITGRKPLARRLVRGLFFGGLMAAVAFGARAARQHDAAPFIAAARVPFYVAFFGTLFVATAAPLLVVRRWLRTPLPLAAIGAVLSPLTIVAQSYAEHGTAATCLQQFLQAPMTFVVLQMPVIAGATVLGWCLAPRVSPRVGATHPYATTSAGA